MRHNCPYCDKWLQLGRAFKEGRQLEALLEAKRMLREESSECQWQTKVVDYWREIGEDI